MQYKPYTKEGLVLRAPQNQLRRVERSPRFEHMISAQPRLSILLAIQVGLPGTKLLVKLWSRVQKAIILHTLGVQVDCWAFYTIQPSCNSWRGKTGCLPLHLMNRHVLTETGGEKRMKHSCNPSAKWSLARRFQVSWRRACHGTKVQCPQPDISGLAISGLSTSGP